MRLAVLSDIHGNLPALEAVLADAELLGVGGWIVAGDSTVGPQQSQVFDRLRSWMPRDGLNRWLIRGNSEDYCLAMDAGEAPAVWYSSEQWATTRWAYQQLGRRMLDYLASLPEQCVVGLNGAAPIRVVHGSPSRPNEHLYPDKAPDALRAYREQGLLAAGLEPPRLRDVLSGVAEPVLVCGHSHIGWIQEGEGRLVVNAGSVGAPNNGDPRAQYALLTWEGACWRARQRAVPYDLAPVRAAWRESGLLAEGGAFARACLLAIETGQNVPGRFLAHAFRLAAEVGYEGQHVVQDEIWEQAAITFDWQGAM